MAFADMVQRMIQEVPGMPASYARTLINESLGLIFDEQMWSWQLKESGWLTPGLLFPQGPGTSTGTITVTPYSNIVTGDASASAQWAAYVAGGTKPLLTQLQIRSPYYSLYNIIAYAVVGGFGQFTLDRPWMEPGGSQQSYMIYQAYFVVPVPDFKRFLAARDTTNNYPMDFWTKTQKKLSVEDPERTIFDDPLYFVPYQTDQRPGSSTLGYMMYELWPHPLSVLPYTYNYLRRGPQLGLTNSPPAFSTTVPYPLTEETVLWRAKSAAYMWKEAQKGEQIERGSGADFKFLAQAAEAQHKRTMKPIKDRDRDLAELYWDKFRRDTDQSDSDGYATITGELNVGHF